MSYNRVGPGWKDLMTDVIVRGAAANDPTFTAWRGNMYAYEFVGATTMKQCWASFHLDHDYQPNTEVYLHVHYLNGTAGGSGNIQWNFEITYARRDVSAFPVTTTVSAISAVSSTQYQHQVFEVPTGLPTSAFETDGMILARVFRDPTLTGDTYANSVWLLKIDAHYQTDHYCTQNKSSPFF